MVESLTELMNREWNVINGDTNNYTNISNKRLLSRKISDNTTNYQSTNESNETSTMVVTRPAKPLANRTGLDTSYDTDGALGTSKNRSKHRHTCDNCEYLVSPRLPVRRNGGQPPKAIPPLPLQQRPSYKTHLTANTVAVAPQNHEDRDEDTNYDGDIHRRSIRVNRRVHQQPFPNANYGAHVVHPFAVTPSIQPLRIIFMRHGERANQALGPDWFIKAFRTNTYRAYDHNLPFILPKRRFDQAYEFDVPLTGEQIDLEIKRCSFEILVRGLKSARLTGRTMATNNLVADICLASTALRCVQTCERILTGMDRRNRIPIRIEPGLFECPHYNYKVVESFMSKRELMENRYNIKHDYKPIISKVIAPETLEEYFERSAAVMRGIIDRYGPYGGTVLIVTHAPGLLALTDAMKGVKTNPETFYRMVSMFPPLATYIAEYDGSKWRYSNQPFNFLLSAGQ